MLQFQFNTLFSVSIRPIDSIDWKTAIQASQRENIIEVLLYINMNIEENNKTYKNSYQ